MCARMLFSWEGSVLLEKRSGNGGGRQNPRSENTRVYAPTHRSAQGQSTGQEPGQLRKKQPSSSGRQSQRAAREAQPAAPSRQRPQAKRQEQPRKPARQTVLRQPAVQTEPVPKKRPSARQENAKRRTPPPDRRAGYENIHRVENVARKERQAQKEQSKAARREARRVRRAQREPMDRNKLLTLLIVVVAFIGLLAAGYFVFLVDTIVVDGNERYSEGSIISLSGLVTGRHMLLANLDKAQEAMEENPYIKVVGVERELPRTLRITIEERVAVAAIAVQDYDVVIDVEGHVLAIGADSGQEPLLRVTGISQLGFKLNQKLGTSTDIQIRGLLLILEQLAQENLGEDITSIDLANPLRLTMRTKEGITVVLGQSDGLDEKIRWLKLALPSLRAGGIASGTLDVGAKGGAIYSPPGQLAAEPESATPTEPVQEPGTATPTEPSE